MTKDNSPPPLMTDKELLMETGAFNEIMNAAFEYADAYCASGDEPRRYSAAIDHLRKTVRAEITKFSRANYKTNAATEFDAQAVAAQAPAAVMSPHAVRDYISNHIADNWPMKRRFSLEEIVERVSAIEISLAATPALPATEDSSAGDLAEGPAGSGGWKVHAESLEKECAYWKTIAETMRAHACKDVWYWQADGSDNPQSMVNSLAVVLRADQLRDLLAQAKAEQQVHTLLTSLAPPAPAAVAVPEGYALVPIEPTPGMRKAAADGWLDCGSKMILNKAAAAYRAALAATPAAKAEVLPAGWVPCTITYEGQYPEDVAYGPKIMMDRLKNWLGRYFALKAEVQAEQVADDSINRAFARIMELTPAQMAERLKQYEGNAFANTLRHLAEPVAWDGQLPGSLQRALNELRIDGKPNAVSSLEFEVRHVFEGMHTSLATVRRMYRTASDRLEAIEGSQPDPLTAPQAQPADALDERRGGKWLTVVYRDVQPGDEAREIGSHQKVAALSWSHALDDRDAAMAAAQEGGKQ